MVLYRNCQRPVLLGDELSAFIDKVEASEFFSEKSCNSNMYFSNVF